MIDLFTPRLKVKTRKALFDVVSAPLPAKLSLEESFYVFPCCNLRFNPHLTQTGIFQEECHA